MSSYGQFCPVAKAMEMLDERWTLLVVRELIAGSTHFNELRRGVPRMSPALLSKRLRTLERAGVITRIATGRHVEYLLTPCGRELTGIVEGLGTWGLRWVGQLGEQDLDPHLLLWDMRRTIPVQDWPAARTVVAFELRGVPQGASRWWLVVVAGEVDVCDDDPSFPVDVVVDAELATLTRIWRGDLGWAGALRAGLVKLRGRAEVCRSLPALVGQARLAAVPRPREGPRTIRPSSQVTV